MARKPAARRVLIAVLALIVGGLGCNPLLMPFQFLNLNRSRIPSEFNFYHKAKAAKKKKEITIVVLSYPGRGLAPEFIGSDRTLTSMFVNCLKAGFESNREHVKIVPLTDVEKFKRDHDDWRGMDQSEICKQFAADYLIDMELSAMTLYEPGTKALFRGHLHIPIHIVDSDKTAADLFPPYDFDFEYPASGGSIAADLDMSRDKFQQQLFAKAAVELTRLFTGIPTADQFR
jgi:hypothetical protein